MPKVMDPVLPMLLILGYWAIMSGTFGGRNIDPKQVSSNGLHEPFHPVLQGLGALRYGHQRYRSTLGTPSR